MKLSHATRALAIGTWLILGATLLSGCYNPFRPREIGAGISSPPPPPNSPSNVLRLLEWTYNHRAIAEYREIFTADYRFAFSALDPYGNTWQGDTWSRDDELISATNLFQGGHATEPAAINIQLFLDRSFNVRDDTRPGKNPRWHKLIRTSQNLTIVDPNRKTLVTGHAIFYVVRGDSALIPEELVERGFGPDSTRWYIDRWEDQSTLPNQAGTRLGIAPTQAASVTIGPTRPGSATPAAGQRQQTWGAVKAIYRGTP